jgi:phage terminase large subunit
VSDYDFAWQPKQLELRSLVRSSEATWLTYGGSNGGAKSDTARKIMLERRDEYPGTRGLLLRRTYSDLYDNHIVKYFKDFPFMRDWYDGTHREFSLPNGSIIKMGYADNKGDVERAFQGKDYMDICVDEATHFHESDLTYLKTVNRWPGIDDRNCKMLLTCNPGAVGHANVGFAFLKRINLTFEYHGNENPKDYKFLPSFAWDNVEWSRAKLRADGLSLKDYYSWSDKKRFKYFLKTGYGQSLNSLPETLRIGRLLGSWNQFGGQYFDFFDSDPSKGYVQHSPILKSYYQRWISLDYGFDHNSAVYWHVALPDGTGRTYDELVINNLTPTELATKMAIQNNGQEIQAIYVDPSTDAQKESHDTVYDQLSRAFERLGLPHCSKADNDRKGGWMLVYHMLKTGEIAIDPKCQELIKKLPAAMRKEEDKEDIQKFDGDDELDSFRYGWKSKMDAAQAPLDVRMQANLESFEAAKDQYGRPISKTEIMRRLQLAKKREEEATQGQPWTLKVR